MEKRDIPIKSIVEDQFRLSHYVSGLCEFLRQTDKPVTISIQGEWGSGKTSFMNMIEDELCRGTGKYSSIWINTWDFFLEGNYDVVVNRLVGMIISKIEAKFRDVRCKRTKEELIKDFKNYSKKFSKAVLSITGLGSSSGEALIDDLFGDDISLSIRDLRDKFEKFITQIVEESGATTEAFIIFVDDLDRIQPKMAITILEALKILFDIKHCIFVIAIDYEVVASGVEQKYGGVKGTDRDICRAYFDKLIQVPFVLPTARYEIAEMVMQRLREIRFMNTEYDYRVHRDDILNIIRLTTNNNPRTIKRLLNMIHLTTIMDRERIDNTSAYYQLLELLLVAMQLAYPSVYQLMQSNEDFTSWKKNILVNVDDTSISEHIREGLDIDCEWKEVLYLMTVSDPLLRSNYTKIQQLLEIFQKLMRSYEGSSEYLSSIFGVLSMTDVTSGSMLPFLYDGQDYDRSSQTQFRQGNRLIEAIEPDRYTYVLDVGCGNGKTTFELLKRNPAMRIDAFDISETQIEVARKNCEEKGLSDRIDFFVMDALELDEKNKYDLVFSNATLHWITNSRRMYTLLYNALKPGGRLAVHQGGHGSYEGLHRIVRKAYRNLGFEKYFRDWTFPVFYTTESEIDKLLADIGFRNIRIDSVKTDGSELEHLVENFEKASLIFYRPMLKSDEEYKALVREYYRLCSAEEVDKSTHRLYIFADK